MAEPGPTTNQTEGLSGVHPSGASYAVDNVVVNVDVGAQLNLPQLARRAPNTEYGAQSGGIDATGKAKKGFNCVTMRITAPRATAAVHASGKMVVKGTKSLSAARLAVQNFCRAIESAGFDVDQETVDATLAVVNIVVSCSAGFPINLHGLHKEHHACATYEPGKFSGLTYKMAEPKVTITIHGSGKFSLKGVKHEEDISTILDNIHPVLGAFRLKEQSIPPKKAAPAAGAARRRTAASAAAAAAGAGPAAGPTRGPVSSSSGGGNSITQLGPSTVAWQPQEGFNPLVPGAQQQEAKGLKRPRPAAEVLKAAASAGRLPPAMAARAAAGNHGLRLGEVLTTAGTAQPSPMQHQLVLPPATQQQMLQAGPALVYPPILQHSQLGFPWAAAAFQPHGLGTQLQAPAAAAGVMGLQGLLPQQQQLLGALLQQQLLQQQQEQFRQQQQLMPQPHLLQQPQFMHQQLQPQVVQQQLLQFLLQPVQQQQQPQYVQQQSLFMDQQLQLWQQPEQQELQQQHHPADPAANQHQEALADPAPSEVTPPSSPSEMPPASPVHEMPPASPPYQMPPASPPYEMPPASPARGFDA